MIGASEPSKSLGGTTTKTGAGSGTGGLWYRWATGGVWGRESKWNEPPATLTPPHSSRPTEGGLTNDDQMTWASDLQGESKASRAGVEKTGPISKTETAGSRILTWVRIKIQSQWLLPWTWSRLWAGGGHHHGKVRTIQMRRRSDKTNNKANNVCIQQLLPCPAK